MNSRSGSSAPPSRARTYATRSLTLSRDWNDFIRRTASLSPSQKGCVFEVLVKCFLQLDPKYRTILKNVTGFGIASRLPRERQSPGSPEFIAGTLAYMAPEQTGRVNRSIDSRSDLYSLGVTLYEMLTGSLPFAASDPMEWVHCHIARQPATPSERLRSVPVALRTPI